MDINPAHMQFSFDVLLSDGKLSSFTVGEPGAHGAGVQGIQGIGVSAPIAAAVAAATDGFAMLLHRPKGLMFTIGAWSIIFAENWFPDFIK